MLRSVLAHPLTRGHDIDSPEVTHLRYTIIQQKPFLKQIYAEWYQLLRAALSSQEGPVLELGSGAGFLRQYIPRLITSDVFTGSGLDLVADGTQLPLEDASLRAIVMTDVLHHIPDVSQFLHEAARCVQPGGHLAMIEPWVTPWSRLIYTHLHHEPFFPDAPTWDFPPTGPLSGANGALPWIVFFRDQEQFEQEFPMWDVLEIQPFMPFRYLVSGGVSLRSLTPPWSTGAWRKLEHALLPWMDQLAMFAFIVLRHVTDNQR